MRYIVKKFDSVSEYARYLEQPQSKLFNMHGHNSSERGTFKFTNTTSWSEAQDLLRFGDRFNLARLKNMVTKAAMKGTGEQVKTETYRSFVGYAPHVPSYVSGQPKTMLRKKVVKTQNEKVLNIAYDPSANCKYTATEMLEASVKVLNFIISLEKQGYKINLYSICSSQTKNECAVQILKIKASDEYTDMCKMVYPMVNPSFFRRHFFRFLERNQEITEEEFPICYGWAVDDTEAMLRNLPIKVDYYLSFYEHQNQINKYKAVKR